MNKTCKRCVKQLPLSGFYTDKRNNRPRSYCKSCWLLICRPAGRKHDKTRLSGSARQTPASRRKSDLKVKYGLSLADYESLYTKQGGVCAICWQPESIKKGGNGAKRKKNRKTAALAIDHDHNSNVVRGLLCNRCNLLLGKAHDNIEILKSAINYLKTHELKTYE